MKTPEVIVVGGGAAGVFAAITAAEAGAHVTVLERSARFLGKVLISGGGRCNVTHACFDRRDLTQFYPRGERALIGPFQRFATDDTVAWFVARGVALNTEPDGRMFPVTDDSRTIVDCLLESACSAGVKLRANAGVAFVRRGESGGFEVGLAGGEALRADRVLLATGGCRSEAGGGLAVALGHTLEAPVPSLFTFHVELPWLRALAGLSVADVEVSVPALDLLQRGALLVTHWGLSGPAILKLSAWGARGMHACGCRFAIAIDWLPGLAAETLQEELRRLREAQGARMVRNAAIGGLPARLWERLVEAAGVAPETRWSSLSRAEQQALVGQLRATRFDVTGRSLNKDEFVTCGGVRLAEVDFKTMQSKLCPGLHFAGELLDIDGLTGGFNFQAAWTTGWIAGKALGVKSSK